MFAGQHGYDIYMRKKLIRGVPLPVPANAIIEPRKVALSINEIKEVCLILIVSFRMIQTSK